MSAPRFRPPRHFLLPLLAVGLVASIARGERLVVLRSTAQDSYLAARKQPDGSLRPETYVFMPGRFIPGESQDASLEKTPFVAVARELAPPLHAQNYLPAASLGKADLLLVVHWGATPRVEKSFKEDASTLENIQAANEQMDAAAQFEAEQRDEGNYLPSVLSVRPGLDQQLSNEIVNLRSGQVQAGIESENSAQLLGIQSALSIEDGNLIFSEKYRALHEMTREERYFIVVVAYDAAELLRRGRLRKCWTLRASVRSAGVNFRMAMDRIGVVAAKYFGKAQHEVVLEKAVVTAGRVEMGEIRIIESFGPAK